MNLAKTFHDETAPTSPKDGTDMRSKFRINFINRLLQKAYEVLDALAWLRMAANHG